MRPSFLSATRAFVVLCVIGATLARADDWNNSGGNSQRNGQTSELGPDAQDLLWGPMGRSSIIAWQPAIEGNRVFLVRQTGFPPSGEPNGSPVVAMDLDTGAELWVRHIPFNESGDWTTWVAGARDGKVYASRSGNGASVADPMYALDAATGNTVWISAQDTDAGAYDGVVFADNGDLIVGSFRNIWRIRAANGTTAWVASRVGSVSGSCGVAVFGNGVYAADAAPGGHVIKKFDLATGAFQYQSPVMPGFTLQNTPFAGSDGTIYLSRTQNNASVDYFYAFADTGAALVQKWSVPAGWSTHGEWGVGPDHTVYMIGPGNMLQRRDPDTGTLLNFFGPIEADFLTQRFAVDRNGRVFFSNGAFSNGRLFSFNADLTLRWSEAVPNANIGTPSIGRDGTLLIAGVGSNIKTYRTPRAPCDPCDTNCDGSINGFDIQPFVDALSPSPPAGCSECAADTNADGSVNAFDIQPFVECLGG